MRHVVLDLAMVKMPSRCDEPRLVPRPVELETMLFHQSPDAEYGRAILQDQELRVHAQVWQVDFELALRRDIPFAVAKRTLGHGLMSRKTSPGIVFSAQRWLADPVSAIHTTRAQYACRAAGQQNQIVIEGSVLGQV